MLHLRHLFNFLKYLLQSICWYLFLVENQKSITTLQFKKLTCEFDITRLFVSCDDITSGLVTSGLVLPDFAEK